MAINDIFTAPEAAKLWGLDVSTIKKACTGQKGLPPRFTAEEARKSEGTWLVTKSGMERLYGAAKTN